MDWKMSAPPRIDALLIAINDRDANMWVVQRDDCGGRSSYKWHVSDVFLPSL